MSVCQCFIIFIYFRQAAIKNKICPEVDLLLLTKGKSLKYHSQKIYHDISHLLTDSTVTNYTCLNSKYVCQ